MKPSNSSNPAERIMVAQVVETMTMGGAENLAVRIANAFCSRGFAAHIIVMTEPGILSGRISPGVMVHYLGFRRASIKNPVAFPLSIIAGAKSLIRLIKSEKIQLVQTHLPGANFWGLVLEILGVCPVLATVHNNQEFKYGDADSPIRSRLRRFAYKWIVSKCAGTIAVSSEVKNSLVRDLGLGESAKRRISVVSNGVSIPDPLSNEAKSAARSDLGIQDGVPLILAAGRFGPQKNFRDLLKVASELNVRQIDFQLVIGGEGEQLEEMRTRVASSGLGDRVVLPGNLKNLDHLMLAADVFVMTSLWEGLPLVLLEAMAAGLPAVAFDIPGVRELVDEGENGHLIPAGDTQLFATKLGFLLEQPAIRANMGASSRRRVEQEFDFEKLVDKLSAEYGRVVFPEN